MRKRLNKAIQKSIHIRDAKIDIYDTIEIGDPQLWFTSLELTEILNNKIVGVSFNKLPLRTRSKYAKEIVCKALGYPVPKKFNKIRPRFQGQQFDIYVQKSNNLQIWNDQLDPKRRYVLIRIDDKDKVSQVKVVTGTDLSELDTTGTLTQKFQARLSLEKEKTNLDRKLDTAVIRSILSKSKSKIDLTGESPDADPDINTLLDINTIFDKLKGLVGKKFEDTGRDQERNRGLELQKLVCKQLGYEIYRDNGQFPDLRHQLLEIKLQTSATIDLGLVCPDSTEFLDVEKLAGNNIRHCDVRYAIFYGEITKGMVMINHLYITTGEDFFSLFTRFGGKILNKKIQIPLSKNYFID